MVDALDPGAPSHGAPRCRLCAAPVTRQCVDLGLQPLADDVVAADDGEAPRRALRLLRCDACGLLQTAATGDGVDLLTHGHGARASTSLQAHLAAWGASLAPELRTGDRVLDVAPHEPALHEPLQARGAEVIAAGADGFLGAQGIREAVARSGTARLVIANHALAHADDLRAMVDALREAVADDGRLAIETHHALALLDGDQVDVVSHAHRSYLSLAVLRKALDDAGVDVVEATSLAAYGGALRVLARPRGGGGAGLSRVPGPAAGNGVIDTAEADAGLTDGTGLDALASRLEARRGRLRSFLEAERASGRRVAGYGAPGRAVTLLNWAGVDGDLLPWTVDRSPAKQGGWIPGTGIRVRAPEALERDPVDTILILAWTLLDELRIQLEPVVARGARLAVAAPEPGFVA